MDRESMVDFIVRNASGNTSEVDIRNYYRTTELSVVESDYQRLLQHEKLKITSRDAETVKAEQSAQQAQRDAAQGLRDYRRSVLCQHNFGGQSLANVQSNWDFIDGWAQGQVPTPAWLQSILDQDPKAKKQLAWTRHESSAEQQQRKQETDEQTKRTLLEVCRRYNYSFSDANISLVLQHFPEGCTQFDLEQAIQNGLHLHGADWAEMEEHTKALVRAHNVKYANMGISQLKANSAQEKQEREAIFARVTLEPTRPVGITPLPEAITADKIKNASRETIAMWKSRYSLESLNARLQGLA